MHYIDESDDNTNTSCFEDIFTSSEHTISVTKETYNRWNILKLNENLSDDQLLNILMSSNENNLPIPLLQPITIKDDDTEDMPISLPERDPTMPHLAPIYDTTAYRQVMIERDYHHRSENLGIHTSFGNISLDYLDASIPYHENGMQRSDDEYQTPTATPSTCADNENAHELTILNDMEDYSSFEDDDATREKTTEDDLSFSTIKTLSFESNENPSLNFR